MKKKNIALKALKHESGEESELNDKDMTIMAKRFRKFLKRTSEWRTFKNYRNQKKKNESISYDELIKPVHIQ